ncbi:hypothetical protein GCM10027430_29070 [Lysobacter tyrosinilyticus]
MDECITAIARHRKRPGEVGPNYPPGKVELHGSGDVTMKLWTINYEVESRTAHVGAVVKSDGVDANY